MSPADFERVERCFESAMDLAPPERAAWLNAELAGSPELRAEVQALLSAAAGTDIVGRLVESALDDFESTSFPDEIGCRIGRYLIVREIGRGGMATVYQAIRQEAGFVQTVALKLVRRGMDSDHIVRRFRAERQILANLRHPHIAALLDGGAAPDGRPYLIMEFIEGEPAVEYVSRRNLSLRKRLELFSRICDAVVYAHVHGVIHRDIKPANVLVTSDGAPKLLDFGIAKVLMPEMAPDAPDTGVLLRLLTPEYASPEQIKGEPVTAATDVYALGVLLFEMLTARRPFPVRAGSAPDALDRRFRAGLSGDLDKILAVALRKQPELRYGSVAKLRADIESYLEGRPVSAHRDTVAYRAAKWIQRNPFRATAAFLLVLALVAAVLFTSTAMQSSRNRRAADLVQRARHLMQHDPRTSAAAGGIPTNYANSLALLEQATSTAPEFAPAWLLLSEVAELASGFDNRQSAQLLAVADRASRRAVELDPRAAHAWEMRAVVLGHQKNEQGALEAFEKSVQLNPRSPYAVRGYANILHRRGRTAEALAIIDRALVHLPDPANPDPRAVSVRGRVVLLAHKAMLLYQSGRSAEALPAIEAAMNTDGSYRLSYWVAGLVHEALGDLAAAEQKFRTGMRMAPQDARLVAGLAHVLARASKWEEAQRAEEILAALHRGGQPVACELAIVRTGFGDTAGAIQWLSQLNAPDSLPTCATDPRLAAVRTQLRITRSK